MVVIYSITNQRNNKRYIGISVEFPNRKRNHLWHLRKNKHSNVKLQNAYNKYGEENFSFDVLEELDNADKMTVLEKEHDYIKKYDTFKSGYNMSEGFDGSTLVEWTERQKKLASERWKGNDIWLGRKQSPEHIKKRTAVHKGKVLNDETKRKISESRLGKYRGEENPFYGRSHTSEVKQTLSNKLGKKIVCNETGEVFNSLKACADKMDLDRRNIQRVCVGKYKQTKGYSFKFVD